MKFAFETAGISTKFGKNGINLVKEVMYRLYCKYNDTRLTYSPVGGLGYCLRRIGNDSPLTDIDTIGLKFMRRMISDDNFSIDEIINHKDSKNIIDSIIKHAALIFTYYNNKEVNDKFIYNNYCIFMPYIYRLMNILLQLGCVHENIDLLTTAIHPDVVFYLNDTSKHSNPSSNNSYRLMLDDFKPLLDSTTKLVVIDIDDNSDINSIADNIINTISSVIEKFMPFKIIEWHNKTYTKNGIVSTPKPYDNYMSNEKANTPQIDIEHFLDETTKRTTKPEDKHNPFTDNIHDNYVEYTIYELNKWVQVMSNETDKQAVHDAISKIQI